LTSDLNRPSSDEGESKKPSAKILQQEISEARSALERSNSRLFMSGLSAGLDIGFSLFLMAIVHTLAVGVLPHPVVELLMANMYAFGFVVVVIGRSELFTEQTSLAILPLLAGKTSFQDVARLWAIVYVSNLMGAAGFAALVTWIGPALGVIERGAFGEIAHRVVTHEWWVILLSGVLAGWLLGLLSWLVAAGRDTISQIVIVWLITTAIGFGHLHHTVVGSVEVLAGVFSGSGATPADFGHFLLWTTLGNAVGGPFFVALIKYGHARPSANSEGG
jgi:formate/nitrite transporter FocA (FNT family)